jgi:hypothetical protein
MNSIQVTEHFGGDYQAAIALSVSYQTILNWHKHGIPLVRQQSIELMTKGKLQAEEVQP